MYEEQPHDFDLKFSDTIGRVQGVGLLRFDHFSSDDFGRIISSVSKVVPRSGFSIQDEPVMVVKELIDWRYPRLGWINTHRQAIFCYRNSKAGQAKFKKGFSMSSINMDYTQKDEMGSIIREMPGTVAHYIFNPEYFGWDKALELIRKGKRFSVAIDHKYAIVVDFVRKTLILRRNNTSIGLVTGENKVFISGYASFLVEDLQSRNIPVVL